MLAVRRSHKCGWVDQSRRQAAGGRQHTAGCRSSVDACMGV